MSDELAVQREWIERDLEDWRVQAERARARAEAAKADAREAEQTFIHGHIIRKAITPFVGRPLADAVAQMAAVVAAAEDRVTAADAEAQKALKEAATAQQELLCARAVVAFLRRQKAAT